MAEPITVLYVCTANICRSLYADGRTRQILAGADDLVVASAGTHGFVDQPLDTDMRDQLELRGEVPQLSSQRLTAALVSSADVVLTATAAHRAFVLDEWPFAATRTFTMSQFAEALGQVGEDVPVGEVVRAAYRARGPARSSGDITDPYRRGRVVSAEVASRLDEIVSRIVPRLRGRR